MPANTTVPLPAGLAGVIFVVLSGSAAVAVPQMPQAGASPSVVLDYVQANQRALEWTWFLAGEVAWLFGLYFCAALAVSLWSSSPHRAATLAGLAGAVVTAALTVSAAIPWGLLIYLGPHLADDLVLTLAEARHFADAALSFSTAAMLLGFSVSAIGVRSDRFRALASGGLLATALQLFHGMDDFVTYGQTGILPRLAPAIAIGWVLAASALMLIEVLERRATRVAGRDQLAEARGV